MKVNRYVIPILVVLTLLGSVWVAKAAGVWQTSGRGDVLLDETGAADPAGIKGWMTLSDISDTYGVPLDDLYAMIGASSDVSRETPLKDLEQLVPGLEVSAVREAVAAYLEGTWVPEADAAPGQETPGTPLPEATPQADPGTETSEDGGDEASHTPAGAGTGTGPDLVLPADGSALPGAEIRGRMTLQEVVDLCQVPLDHLVETLGLPPDVDTSLRMADIASQFGIEVLTVREVVNQYQAGR